METENELSDRRSFLQVAGVGIAGVTASALTLSGYSLFRDDTSGQTTNEPGPDALAYADVSPDISWQMTTSWPENLTNLHAAATDFARLVAELTEGRFKITVHPSNAIAGALETLSAMEDGVADISHSSGHLYSDADPIFGFLASMPFGLSQRQQNAWLYQKGGLEALNKLTAQRSDTIAFPCGGAGCQMGGWFTDSIYTNEDIEQLQMHLPGLAGQVLERLGGTRLSIPPDELLLAVQTRTLGAAAFGGPSDDSTLGLNQIPGELRYYHPGWWGAGDTYEIRLPVSKWESLPPHYRRAVEVAAQAVHVETTARYDVDNAVAIAQIREVATISRFTASVLTLFDRESTALLDEISSSDADFTSILEGWRDFRKQAVTWHSLAENEMHQHQRSVLGD